jgi:hypothetical protein
LRRKNVPGLFSLFPYFSPPFPSFSWEFIKM